MYTWLAAAASRSPCRWEHSTESAAACLRWLRHPVAADGSSYRCPTTAHPPAAVMLGNCIILALPDGPAAMALESAIGTVLISSNGFLTRQVSPGPG